MQKNYYKKAKMKMSNSKKKAVILLSSGLDSVVSLYCLKDKYNFVMAITFDYGQESAKKEIRNSKKIADLFKIEHKIIKLNWLKDLCENKIPQINEKDLKNKEKMKETAKSVWIPNRNAIFINIAGAFCEKLRANYIVIGANKEEGETFKDNSQNFIEKSNELFKFSSNEKIEIG